eukprot:jgi/Psemu1/33914/gm1.33914_g
MLELQQQQRHLPPSRQIAIAKAATRNRRAPRLVAVPSAASVPSTIFISSSSVRATTAVVIIGFGVCFCGYSLFLCALPTATAWTFLPYQSVSSVRSRLLLDRSVWCAQQQQQQHPLRHSNFNCLSQQQHHHNQRNRKNFDTTVDMSISMSMVPTNTAAEDSTGSGTSPLSPSETAGPSRQKRQKRTPLKQEPDALLTPIPAGVLATVLGNNEDENENESSPPLLELPTKLAYPFWYDPHPIAKWAADRLRDELPPWQHSNDGDSDSDRTAIALGKMYGVLVVRPDGTTTTTTKNNDDDGNSGPQLGYLKAYSGTMPRPQYGGAVISTIDDSGFCPLVYDRFRVNNGGDDDNDDFCYEREEDILNGYTREIERLETCPERKANIERWREEEKDVKEQLSAAKKEQKSQKRLRKERRTKLRKRLLEEIRQEVENGQQLQLEQQLQQQHQQHPAVVDPRGLSDKESHNYFLEHSEEYRALEDQLVQESASDQRDFKVLRATLQTKLDRLEASRTAEVSELESLKQKRKEGSNHLQNQLFLRYKFLNAARQTQTPLEVFRETPLKVPPAGAGDCAAIKLFQHAFSRGYAPVALAEFWWGPSPHSTDNGNDNDNDSTVARTHGNYYPCCRGKCEPILTRHMLLGTPVESDPLTEGLGIGGSSSSESRKLESLPVVYEDEWMVVVNKPHDVLSVPGRTVPTSVQTTLQQKHPNALLVHRLDYSTSGLLLAAKDSRTHKKLQAQFIARTVQKRYTALLDGEWPENRDRTGAIDLPLAGDYMNRPMQKVDRGADGKPAVTRYEIVATPDASNDDTSDNDNNSSSNNNGNGNNPTRAKLHRPNKTRVRFYPVTGRTHQLRVHASHPEGLGMAIVGDDIYGTRDERLCLHAGILQFTHPVTGEPVALEAPDPF